MRSTYQAIDVIYKMLVDAQTPANGLPWVISPGTDIFDFQPGDFTVDGQPTQDGIYLFFDKTRFDAGLRSDHNQSHGPRLTIDLYTSISSTKSTGTGAIEFSTRRADRAIRNMAIEIYEAVNHTEFHRRFNETLLTLYPTVEWSLGGIMIMDAVKTGVLRLKHSKNCIAHQRMTCVPEVTEIHNKATGVAYDGSRDLIEPYRVEP